MEKLNPVMKHFVGDYLDGALNANRANVNKYEKLFSQRKVPDEGWSEREIEQFFHMLSAMDSNNFSGNCGVGERESRFASDIVARRHFWMGHGIGRSGDIAELQPKAVGSSLLNRLTNELVLDILRSVGAPGTKKCLIVPMATGMSLMLCLRTLHSMRPDAKYVIWSRIDQKSCFKCILTAGLTPIIINCKVESESLVTDLDAISRTITETGRKNIVCVMTTTSCFAPRSPDSIEEVGEICKANNIPHVINNAYGIQCESYMETIEKASKSRVDLYVSSTDKNFLVPVGGSIIAGFDENLIDSVGKMYAGRASCTPSMDVLITLLNIGKNGYKQYLQERAKFFKLLKERTILSASLFHEKVLEVPKNGISIGVSLRMVDGFSEINLVTELGSMLFSRGLSGARIVALGKSQTIGSYTFKNWGSHTDNFVCSYLTAAATIGIQEKDIESFQDNLNLGFNKLQKAIIQISTLPSGDS